MVLLGITTYFVFRRRFGGLLAILLVVFWVATPTDTTRFWLTMTSGKVAMLLTMVAIFAYQRGYRKLSYLLAMPTLWSFESTFFPFFLASALTREVLNRKNFSSHLKHVLITLIVFAVGVYIKYLMNGKNLAPRSQLDQSDFIAPFLHGLILYGVHWFKFFFHSFWVGFTNTSVVSAAIAILFAVVLAKINNGDSKSELRLKHHAELFGLCFLLFVSGLVFSGLGEQYPNTMYGARSSRVYAVASLGGGGLIVMTGWLFTQWAGQKIRWPNVAGFVLLFLGLLGLLTSSFRIQDDYVNAWSKQRNTVISIYDQITDVDEDDIVIFLSNYQYDPWGAGSGVAIWPWGQWMDNLDRAFIWRHNRQQVNGPRMTWSYGLRGSLKAALGETGISPDGVISWPEQMKFNFRAWRTAPVARVGSVIFFVETSAGALRINFPIAADGVVINKIQQRPGRPRLNRQLKAEYRSRLYPESGLFPPQAYGILTP
jgi:hypothetical protein